MRLFDFDEIDENLALVPMAARRALDLAGVHLSLEAWQRLAHAERQNITRAGSEEVVDTHLVKQLTSAARPVPELQAPQVEVSAAVVPEALALALGPERPLPAAVWQALSALERYALCKLLSSQRPERLERAYLEIVGHSAYSSHLDARGAARMVRISDKAVSVRRASAASQVTLTPAIAERLSRAAIPKGDVLGTARLAGILAAKRTSEWIPLCHPLRLTHVAVELSVDLAASCVRIVANVEAEDKTGVEMEALVAASAAALTVYDMLKGLDRSMVIGPTALLEKSGGRSGAFTRER